MEAELLRVRHRRWDQESNEAVLAVILGALPNAVLQLGYGVADLLESPNDRLHPEPQTPLWGAVFGEAWTRIVQAYAAFPAAAVGLADDEADLLLARLARTLDEWLRGHGLSVFHDSGPRIRFHLEL